MTSVTISRDLKLLYKGGHDPSGDSKQTRPGKENSPSKTVATVMATKLQLSESLHSGPLLQVSRPSPNHKLNYNCFAF